MSLLDVLAPPANPWLARLKRNPNHLPDGVEIVRFGSDSDDSAADDGTVLVPQLPGN